MEATVQTEQMVSMMIFARLTVSVSGLAFPGIAEISKETQTYKSELRAQERSF